MGYQYCRICGCDSFRYSPVHHQLVCKACGEPLDSEKAQRSQMEYTVANAKAEEYMRIGEYGSAANALSPFIDDFASDKDYNLLLLRAATKNYTDMQTHPLAQRCWKRLVHMGIITAQMHRYAQDRLASIQAPWKKVDDANTRLAGILLLISLMIWALASFTFDGFIGGAVLYVIVYYNKTKHQDTDRMNRILKMDAAEFEKDPFRSM